jgi:probable F420-dependent oxidoreductase
MVAAADATTGLRIGSYVLANDFRHPAVLAKEAATLDLLSDGRFELGLGAGWNGAEYRRAGIPFGPGRVRVGRLGEAVRIIKASLDGGPVHFDGTHYRTEGVPCPVKTVHSPLPLLLGGGGRRMLTLAGQEASIVGLMGAARGDVIDMSTIGERATRQRIDWIRKAACTRFAEIELNVFVLQSQLTKDRTGAVEAVARQSSFDPAVVVESPHYLLGTREQMAEQLLRLRTGRGNMTGPRPASASTTCCDVVGRNPQHDVVHKDAGRRLPSVQPGAEAGSRRRRHSPDAPARPHGRCCEVGQQCNRQQAAGYGSVSGRHPARPLVASVTAGAARPRVPAGARRVRYRRRSIRAEGRENAAAALERGSASRCRPRPELPLRLALPAPQARDARPRDERRIDDSVNQVRLHIAEVRLSQPGHTVE